MGRRGRRVRWVAPRHRRVADRPVGAHAHHHDCAGRRDEQVQWEAGMVTAGHQSSRSSSWSWPSCSARSAWAWTRRGASTRRGRGAIGARTHRRSTDLAQAVHRRARGSASRSAVRLAVVVGCGASSRSPGSSGSTWRPRRPPRSNSEPSTPVAKFGRAVAAVASGVRRRCWASVSRSRCSPSPSGGCSSSRRCSVRIGPQVLPTSLPWRLLGRAARAGGARRLRCRPGWLGGTGPCSSAAGSGPTGRRRSGSWWRSPAWAAHGQPPAPVRSAPDSQRSGSQRWGLVLRTVHHGARAPGLSSGSLPLPHLGDWTHDGHPRSHRHASIASAVASGQVAAAR